MNRNRAIAQQVGQLERRITRFLSSIRLGRRPVTFGVGRSNRRTAEPQVHRALNALSPSEVMSRVRPRMNVGEALEGQWPLITVRRIESELASENKHKTQSNVPAGSDAVDRRSAFDPGTTNHNHNSFDRCPAS